MAYFGAFTQADADAINESRFIIEKDIPEIVSKFYTQLLRYPPTRKHFMRQDGTLDQEYLQLRMHHLTNFWRRTAYGEFDDNYARYVDYVGRARTSHAGDHRPGCGPPAGSRGLRAGPGNAHLGREPRRGGCESGGDRRWRKEDRP